jgi:hypothetical protein
MGIESAPHVVCGIVLSMVAIVAFGWRPLLGAGPLGVVILFGGWLTTRFSAVGRALTYIHVLTSIVAVLTAVFATDALRNANAPTQLAFWDTNYAAIVLLLATPGPLFVKFLRKLLCGAAVWNGSVRNDPIWLLTATICGYAALLSWCVTAQELTPSSLIPGGSWFGLVVLLRMLTTAWLTFNKAWPLLFNHAHVNENLWLPYAISAVMAMHLAAGTTVIVLYVALIT